MEIELIVPAGMVLVRVEVMQCEGLGAADILPLELLTPAGLVTALRATGEVVPGCHCSIFASPRRATDSSKSHAIH